METSMETCRLCTEEVHGAVNIFTSHNLHQIIQKYLPIEIKENDSFPESVCCSCVNVLEAFDRLVAKCVLANNHFEEIAGNALYEPHSPVSDGNIELQFESSISNTQDCEGLELLPTHSKIENFEAIPSSQPLKLKPLTKNDILLQCKLKAYNRTIYKCDICRKTFKQSYNLLRHYSIHLNKKDFCCHICGKQFRVEDSMLRHIKILHEKLKAFQCTVCNRAFSTKQTLEEHRNIHTDQRPFVCEICGSAFRQRSVLNTHKLFHNPR